MGTERISILVPSKADCPSFTVNTAVNSIDVVDAAASVILRGGNQLLHVFDNGDNVLLLSAGYYIPERFVLWDRDDSGGGDGYACPVMVIEAYRENLGTTALLSQVGDNGYLKLPFPNYEWPLGVFVDAANIVNDDYSLMVQFPVGSFLAGTYMQVSMIDVPAALDTLTFHIIPFVKVQHNFDLG